MWNGRAPNAIAYSMAISACEEAKQPLKAMVLLAIMRQQSLGPIAFTYRAAINACEKAKQPHKAMELLTDAGERLGAKRLRILFCCQRM